MSKIISALAFATLLSLPASAAPQAQTVRRSRVTPTVITRTLIANILAILLSAGIPASRDKKTTTRGTPCIIAGTMLGVQQGRHRCCEPQGTIRSSRDGIEVK